MTIETHSTGQNLQLTIFDEASGASYVTHARAVDVTGRSAQLRADSVLDGRTVVSAISRGGPRATYAEIQKQITILHALQGTVNFFSTPFLQYIYFPNQELIWPEYPPLPLICPTILSSHPLNDSQQLAVEHMLSFDNDKHITMIQGPPGTGKTTVIATYVCSAIASGLSGIWLVAQSNVAVKNIAEKLADISFLNWKLLVSTDFHFGW